MTVNFALQRPLEDFIAYCETLTARSAPLLGKMAAPDMRFIDPFYDVQGAAAVMQVYAAMTAAAGTGRLAWSVTDAAWGRDGQTAYLRWTRQAAHKIDGISEITFDPGGADPVADRLLGSLSASREAVFISIPETSERY